MCFTKRLSTSRLRLSLHGHAGPVYDVAYGPDGNRIATAGGDKTVRIWDGKTGDELLVLEHPTEVGKVIFSPNGMQLASSAGDGLVRLWEVSSAKETIIIRGARKPAAPDPRIVDISFSPDGTLLATVDRSQGDLRLWDPSSGSELFTVSDPDWLNVALVLISFQIGLLLVPMECNSRLI
jgi:WD40 repeat protein